MLVSVFHQHVKFDQLCFPHASE